MNENEDEQTKEDLRELEDMLKLMFPETGGRVPTWEEHKRNILRTTEGGKSRH